MILRILDGALKTLFFALLVGTLALAIFRPDLLTAAVEWLGRAVEALGWWNYPIIFAIACAESFPVIGTILPGQQAMLVVAGFHARVDPTGTVAMAALGACLGNWLGFVVGRLWGKAFLDRYGEWFGLGRTERRYLEAGIESRGAWFVILGKFHNLFRAFVPFLAGTSGMVSARFWLYNIVGSVLWSAVIVALGTLFVAYYETVLAWIQYIILGLLAGFLLYLYVFRREALVRYVTEKRAEIEESAQQR